MKKYFLIVMFFLASPQIFGQNNSAEWIPLGPFFHNLNGYGYVGRVNCIVSSPTNIDEIYIGASTGGFWKSTDGGKSWRCTSSKMPGGIKSIAIHPKKDNIIFAVTGLYANGLLRNGHYGYGIYTSVDFGETWSVVDMGILPEHQIFMSKILFDPSNSDVLYAISLKQVYKSDDLGKTWEILNFKANEGESFKDLEFLNSDTKTLFVSGDGCLYRSNNGGKTWTNIYDNLIDFKTRVSLEITENDLIYAICNDSIKYKNYVKKSYDKGKTWTSKKIRLTGTGHALSVESFNDSIIWVGGVSLYYSDNYGKKFIRKSNKIHADITNIFYPDKKNPNLIYISTDGGVNKTTNGGKTWQNINGNLNINQCYSLAISELDTNLILTGTHDNGTYKLDSTQKWKHIYGGDGGTTLIDFSNSDNIFLACNRSLKLRNLHTKKTKTILSMPTVYDARIYQDTKNPSIIYVPSYHKKKRRAVLLEYNILKDSLPTIENSFCIEWGVISAMAQGINNSNVFYFATYDHLNKRYFFINKTEDNGKIWKRLDFSSHADEKITDIEINNRTTDSVWVTFGRFTDTLKVFATTDGGESWENLTYNLPNVPVYAVEFYEFQNLLLIGTDLGVYFLDEKSEKWERYGKNLPFVTVSDMKINYFTKKIFISTHGRGIWDIAINEQ